MCSWRWQAENGRIQINPHLHSGKYEERIYLQNYQILRGVQAVQKRKIEGKTEQRPRMSVRLKKSMVEGKRRILKGSVVERERLAVESSLMH